MRRLPLLLLLASCATPTGPAPSPAADSMPLPQIDFAPRTYLCRKAATPPVIDGVIAEDEWEAAPWTDEFVDIRGPAGAVPRHATRMKLLWDDEHLYVAAWMDEPHVWGTLTERDSVIYHDNDFEIFLDPDGDTHWYYELEINALGTVWDLLLLTPYRDGHNALIAWDIPGLRTGVHVDGTLDDARDEDRGWSVEIAIPFSVLDEATSATCPPGPGDQWRVNSSRVQWRHRVVDGRDYEKDVDPATGKSFPEDNWVWSPQGLVAMHYPEMWGIVEFAAAGAADRDVAIRDEDHVRWWLRRLYYAQHEYKATHGRFTARFENLELDRDGIPEGWTTRPALMVIPSGFEASLSGHGRIVHIRADGRVTARDQVFLPR